MIVKNSKNTFTVSPFAKILLNCISLIILIFTSTENIYGGTTSIKQFGVDLVSESVPNILCLLATEKEKEPILFYLIVSKNLCFRYKKNILEIKLFSREIGYRASYNYKIQHNALLDNIYFLVNDFNLRNLELTHDHVYDLLSISYGKEYKVKGSSINWYKRINIGFAINFPGEFYYEYLWIHPINLKEVRLWWQHYLNNLDMQHSLNNPDILINDPDILINNPDLIRFNTIKYQHFFKLQNSDLASRYYETVFDSTNISQWFVNILIGLIENIFIEYSFIVPICHFLVICPLHIHISIGTIIGTIEWLYRYFKEEDGDGRGFLGYFYFIFFLNSISVFKIGYYE